MKRTKVDQPIPFPQKKTEKSVNREEFDAQLKSIMEHASKNPKKAAKIFESWLNQPAKSDKKKRAA